jgi:type II secretory pathway pseudopilin PulG
MVLSIGIFSILVTSAIGLTLGISNAQIKAQNIQAILNNIRFSLELITKELRTGSGYTLSSTCAPLGSEISFNTSLGDRRVYFLDGTTGIIMRAKIPLTSGDCTNPNIVKPFTAEEVLVERLNFALFYGQLAGPADGQPRATLSLKVTSRSPKYYLQSSMDLQTTVVQRLRDL